MDLGTDDPDNLIPSELGTQTYWSKVYKREKTNFKNHGDPGEIWFGEESEDRILRWLEKQKISKDKKIVDLGCGNGMMLVSLALDRDDVYKLTLWYFDLFGFLNDHVTMRELTCTMDEEIIKENRSGFTQLTGVDYCSEAVELSKSVADSFDIDDINFQVLDLVGEIDDIKFDIALDKGTYDAISLNPDDAVGKRKKYVENVSKMLNDDGLFVITTCNWTEDEILKHVADVFKCFEVIPTPSFKFGGQVGNVVSALVLQKKTSFN